MTAESYLINGVKTLTAASVPSARLDCLILMEDVTGKSRAWLLAHPEFEISAAAKSRLDVMIKRRVSHEPIAYIRGKSEFYGRDFYVDNNVLEPRPESETIIDLFKALPCHLNADQAGHCVVVDVGTGSGVLAITAKLEMPHNEVYATDIDPACLQVARHNAHAMKAGISCFEADLLAAKPASDANLLDALRKSLGSGKYQHFILMANLPYVPDNFTINQAAMNEPRSAIFGGPDGLDLYRRLFEQIGNLEYRPDYLLTEALPPQHTELADIATIAGYRQSQTQDFIQVFAPR